MSWKPQMAWPSTPTYTARGDKLRTRTIGTNAQDADLIAPHLMKNGQALIEGLLSSTEEA
jgi:hypothetical protein